MNKIAAIIPALNPQQSFVLFVQKLFMLDIERIVIVNDGSDDKYDTIFEELAMLENCHVIHHDRNYGKGYTLKTAFTYMLAHRENYQGVITLGAHGQHTLQDVKLVLTMTKVFSEGIVLGVRNFHSPDCTFSTYWGNWATSLFFEALFHRKLLDTQTGLRYISMKELPWLLEVKGDHFDYDTNMLVAALKRKCPIFEVEIGTLRLKKNSVIHYDEITNAREIITQMLTDYLQPWKKQR
ncbi:glycosyltransferase [Lysinibacillus sp. NPDC097287]|uniref:glycosyltransferase n=1 Tax=Lysinibacillus sp. NPDC097287 TaxID=3364144 RepID=UPI00380E2225